MPKKSKTEKRTSVLAFAILHRKTGGFVHAMGQPQLYNSKKAAENFCDKGEDVVRVLVIVI